MIVVGIEGDDRRHDLTSPTLVPTDLTAAPTAGGADAYRRFLTGELGPWVNAHFRTSGRTGLIGESLAGLFVLETFLDRPDSFSDYIAVSPSLWWNGGRLAARARQSLAARSYAGKRIWIAFEVPAPPAAAAAKDRARQRKVEQAFRDQRPRGLSWTIVHSGEGHGSIYHPAAVEAFRHLYGSGVPGPP
jgi:predicted alpha/beta superfamily hydrolase